MRTNIDIDEKLLARAMKALGQKTKKATVEDALRLAADVAKRRHALRKLAGSGWYGDLEQMRRDPDPSETVP